MLAMIFSPQKVSKEWIAQLQELKEKSPMDEAKIKRAIQAHHLCFGASVSLRVRLQTFIYFLLATIVCFLFYQRIWLLLVMTLFWFLSILFELVSLQTNLQSLDSKEIKLSKTDEVLYEMIVEEITSRQNKTS